MDSRATVEGLLDSLQKGDFVRARSLLSQDFQFSGPAHGAIGGEAWIGMSETLKKAFPDLQYNFRLQGMEGDTANITAQTKGTHSGDLDLTSLDMGMIPASNKSFATSEEHGTVTVKGDKVTSWVLQPTAGAGLLAVLSQLGVKPPSM